MGYINVATGSHLVNLHPDTRQQISPEMRFTCDGMITKWIVGAELCMPGNLYPELQIWRNIGNAIYEKINGTLFQTWTSVFRNIYESDDFQPIPVKSGDILGIFLPPQQQARLCLRSEDDNGPTQYYLAPGSSDTQSIDIEQPYPTILTDTYHPLVSVEFGKYWYNYSSSFLLLCVILLFSSKKPHSINNGMFACSECLIIDMMHHTHSDFVAILLFLPLQSSVSVTRPLPTSDAPSCDRSSSSSGQSSSQSPSFAAGVGVGIAVTLVLMIAAMVVVVVLVILTLKKGQKRGKQNEVEQHSSTSGSPMDNPIYRGKSLLHSQASLH